ARWQSALGATIVDALRREAAVAAAFLTHQGLVRTDLAQQLATVVVEAACAVAFPEGAVALELGRYTHTSQPSCADELAASICRILGTTDKRPAIRTALAPLLASIEEEIAVAASHVRQAAGI